MKKELFIPYKEMIFKCIESCIQREQLFVCHDMTERFKEQFAKSIHTQELYFACDELAVMYTQKHAELNF